MATVAISIVDPHWNDRKPRSRRDDFAKAQEGKLAKIIELTKSIKIDGEFQEVQVVTVAGDLFHQPKGSMISRSLDIMLMRNLKKSACPWVVIPGNHDMRHDRLDSLLDHPYGVIEEAGYWETCIFPKYKKVKGPKPDDPTLIITGKEFTRQGPNSWLDSLRETKELIDIKNSLGDAHVLALTHNHWGVSDGLIMGEQITGHSRILGTGIDVLVYGHPHTYDGEFILDDEQGQVSVIGPGALIRGTLAEHDTGREPKFVVSIFKSNREIKNILVTIPHEPSEVVFDLEKHESQKNEKRIQDRFITELRNLSTNSVNLEDLLDSASSRCSAAIIDKTKKFILDSETELSK